MPVGKLHRVEFLPTPSARRATVEQDKPRANSQFLPTPSARRATGCGQPAPPA